MSEEISLRVRTGIYAFIEQEERILVVTQQKGVHAGKFDLPGGGIEAGELLEEALRRELIEEMALEFGTMHLFNNFIEVNPSIQRVCLIYRVAELSFQTGSNTELNSIWMGKEELLSSPITPLLKYCLEIG